MPLHHHRTIDSVTGAAGGGDGVGPGAPRNLPITIPKWCGKWAVGMDEFKEGVVGAKSRNIANLRGKLPEWVRLPPAVTVPFGSFEKVRVMWGWFSSLALMQIYFDCGCAHYVLLSDGTITSPGARGRCQRRSEARARLDSAAPQGPAEAAAVRPEQQWQRLRERRRQQVRGACVVAGALPRARYADPGSRGAARAAGRKDGRGGHPRAGHRGALGRGAGGPEGRVGQQVQRPRVLQPAQVRHRRRRRAHGRLRHAGRARALRFRHPHEEPADQRLLRGESGSWFVCFTVSTLSAPPP